MPVRVLYLIAILAGLVLGSPVQQALAVAVAVVLAGHRVLVARLVPTGSRPAARPRRHRTGPVGAVARR